MGKTKNKEDKPFNRLAAEFQWTPDLDEDHIFPREREMILKLRDANPDIQDWSDKLILYFLFARRHDLEKTQELLDLNVKMLKEMNLYGRRLTRKEIADLDVGRYMFFANTVDVHDRILVFLDMSKADPKRNRKQFLWPAVWYEIQFHTDVYTVRYLRNGLVLVGNMEGMYANHDPAIKQMDTSSEGKEASKGMMGLFPRRVRQMAVVNGGAIFKIVYQIAKTIMPRKMTKRVAMIGNEDLKKLVPASSLPPLVGGTTDLTVEKFVRDLDEYDARYTLSEQKPI
ncbi:tyrosine-protein phosphatase non-receptor type 9-like [Planoprotostelium fungivorum]|uniref:Tyrosine-protein phosphatase non-receptor type 9-like n=1 Tax=Planoprotostelium fungivorum TaxID=1890364 RepID=A0A2P6NX07_9EUKA|nr:tyrosine-protein phosphatase non-receptor type 9-like [Planoprotostelium fungivorum]